MELPEYNVKEPSATVSAVDKPMDPDEVVLARFNKKQRLMRRFGTVSSIGVTCTIMISWEALTFSLADPLQNGGPGGAVITYLVSWFFIMLQALVFAELASMVPLSGGPFNFVAIFAPKNCRNFLSYLTGWLTLITYVALVAATCYVAASMIQTLVIIDEPDYTAPNWQGTLIYWAIVLFCLFINTHLGHFLPQIESVLLFLHVLAFVAIMISTLYIGEHRSASEVFSTFLNEGGWSSQGLAVLVGGAPVISALLCFDTADHIAEELHNAPKTIPIAIGTSITLNGCLGFGMLLALLFTAPASIEDLLTAQPIFPFIGIFQTAVKSDAGAIALASLVIALSILGSVGMVATSSRCVWAFAREGALPFSKYLSRVHPKNHLPLWAIFAVVLFNVLIGLINIGSTAGFSALISMITAGYQSSFCLAAGVFLHHRLTTPDDKIPWGPFRMPPMIAVPVTVVSIVWAAFGAIFTMFPQFNPTTIETMNYCSLVFGGILILAIGWYFIRGRKYYKGPVMEIEL